MGIIDTFKRAFAVRNRRDPELAYLEEATSLVDLELRHREIDRGRFRRTR
jgi:hypothetical protein